MPTSSPDTYHGVNEIRCKKVDAFRDRDVHDWECRLDDESIRVNEIGGFHFPTHVHPKKKGTWDIVVDYDRDAVCAVEDRASEWMDRAATPSNTYLSCEVE